MALNTNEKAMERGASPLGDNDSDAALLVLPMDSGMSIATGYADSEKTAVVQPQPAIIAVQPAPVIQPAYAAASVTPLRHLKREPAHVDCPHCHERRLTRVTKYKEDAVGDCFVVTASVCGFYCVPTLPIYTAAKHGVVGFVRSYGKHLPAEGISLNAICPNVVRTSISTETFYSDMQARKLLVPMETVVQAFERCLDADISGETLEIETRSGITHRSAPEPFDQDAADTLALLHVRGSPLHAQEQVDN
ncbi:Short-chain dehydrogenase/reductase prx7 [Fulvia fulva]|uniref:Short-chain dehydrogenase/reductase prx7 n=1 Tax=Passalora fulva TaxID=5499 RepID=A0A9Q8P6C7_PASFU|nr:Short-chain dehydrogenase/reductase prx7 [Fulvia fulva]KAK4629690.1 Short-chain dehydrogenase/reductase prx7 [Fulvia fulva]KAK4630212.1 Short-chain dehydrogenase/reductase prx7 [Fulvia fulva]UJO14864.1 Short-chain dehydrogenase/reductase prx7 [Fulvia fulva]WPV12508.1 Short-chain dehydrogenase/reductase prx7 [Fulvia fulva]WPV27176.1 Short-chain dehydrogenase/reductase prx7 [Fulvia fulva]